MQHERLLELVRRAQQDSAALFSECLEGGSADRGRLLFANNITIQCIRCHQVGEQGSQVGPRLDGIASRRDAAHLLRAIIDPSADIEAEYRSVSVLLLSGRVVQGVLLAENDDSITIGDAEGQAIEISEDDIEDLLEQSTSIMPEMQEDLTRRQIRDLVAYLRTLNDSQ